MSKVAGRGRPQKAPSERRAVFLAVRVDLGTLQRIDELCRIRECSRAQVARMAIKAYLSGRGEAAA